uniref:NTF2 domain-containing protein n=1 Tax=Corethron hystrix TaxID=216773 RepID=A0A7S1FYQ3_9STRA|mmetsp:Transcript_39584/g.92569  ORF Transcript_39584/g.92569 Transcript_39584/m.92569 type:complete len:557 (+) Transcript_39584:50-1720(+)
MFLFSRGCCTSHSQLRILYSRFIVKYYQTLTKEPANLHKFYKNVSQFTHGIGSTLVEPVVGSDEIRSTFSSLRLSDAQVDLEDGSLDAQDSKEGGVLIVVTGKITLMDVQEFAYPRHFVHTFFLSREGKKHFYVLNDIFRFLDNMQPPPPMVVPTPEPIVDQTEVRAVNVVEPEEPEVENVIEQEVVEEPSPVIEEVLAESVAETESHAVQLPSAPEPELELEPTPEMGAEESKGEDMDPPLPLPADVEVAGEIGEINTAPVAPGSWASLFTLPGKVPESAFGSPKNNRRAQPQAPNPSSDTKPGRESTDSKVEKHGGGRPQGSGGGGGSKRRSASKGKEIRGGDDGEKGERHVRAGSKVRGGKRSDSEKDGKNGEGGRNTKGGPASLFIKNLKEGITEESVKILFNRFGRVVGTTVNASRGFAFVDYADIASVSAALADKSLLVINGHELDAQPKSTSRAARDSNQRNTWGGGGGHIGSKGGRRMDVAIEENGGVGRKHDHRKDKNRDGSGDRDKRDRRRGSGRGNSGGDRRGKNSTTSGTANGSNSRAPVAHND